MSRIAPLVTAVRRKPAHWMFGVPARLPAASLPDGGTGDVIGLKVEIFVFSAWTDISSFVYYRDLIKISRGRPDETSQVQPQTAALTINNRDGRFSPRNPLGPYYGQIGRNTPIRISRLNNGVRRYRFYGEVPSWPTTWDISGTDVYIQITAAGMLRRINQGNLSLRSAFYRAATTNSPLAVAYWPCEDGVDATSIASGLPSGTPLTLSGQAPPTLASNSDFPSSAPIPLLSASIWTGSVPPYTGGDSNCLNFLMSIPATGAFDTAVVARMYTAGTAARIDVQYGVGSGGSLSLTAYDSSGNQLATTGYQSPTAFTGYGFTGFNAMPCMVVVSQEVIAGTANTLFDVSFVVPALNLEFNLGGFTGTNYTLGPATQVVINPDGNIDDTALGQVAYFKYSGIDVPWAAFEAWLGEPPLVSNSTFTKGRFLRLCQEQGIPAVAIDATGVNSGDPTGMGYQLIDTFANLLQEPVDTSQGLLFESRDQLALVLRERGSLYNQAAKLTLDYSQNQLSAPLDPVDDDALTRNDITVTRTNGSSLQVLQTTGTLSVLSPPNGVGDYDTTYSLSLSADTLIADQAGWLLHLGTVDEPRYPSLSVNLRHETFTTSVDMMNAALTTDIGDRLVVANPPAWMPPDPITQIVQGYTETLGIYEHDMVFNCSPEDPYHVAILEDLVLGHADTDGSTLALPATATATALTIATTGAATGSPLWTPDGNDLPFDLSVGGERVTVTGVSTSFGGFDGSFESGSIAGWSATNCTGAITGTAYSGTKAVQVTTTITSGFMTFYTGATIPVTAGVTYAYGQWVQLVSGTNTYVQGVVSWYTADGAFISSVGTPVIAPTSTWTNQSSSLLSAPGGAAFAQVGLSSSLSAICVIGLDNVYFQPAQGPQAITVTRSINGVIKSQTAGTDVRLWQPMTLSL